jgi:hypothetical protein
MPRNGYWVECIPLDRDSVNQAHLSPDLYSASSGSFPDVTETASSPDQAIEKLRDRLRTIRQHYHLTGKILPEMDNPVRPPTRLRSVQGWISVYINIGEKQGAKSVVLHALTVLALLNAAYSL